MAEPVPPTYPREVIGLFADRESFESAVGALMQAGFERAELSVLASHESIDVAKRPEKTWREVLTALVGEARYESSLVASGAIFLAGGPMAATLAAVIGAAVGGMAIKEILDDVTAKPHSEDFVRSVEAGSVILWVRTEDREQEAEATRILGAHGAANVHSHAVPPASG